MNKTFFRSLFFFSLLALAAPVAAAVEEIGIEKYLEPGNTKPIWVSVSGFAGEALQVLQFDLYVQGFAFTNADAGQYFLSGSNNGDLTGRATNRDAKSK